MIQWCDVIKNVVISEKSEKIKSAREGHLQYCFYVDRQADKGSIRTALKKTFNVDVERVTVSNYRGKQKFRGMKPYKDANFKKAYVVLKAGQSIKEIDERI